ncbi:MAG TPA: MarR family transcriptional regulator [Solirubrobacterales bacterium]|nr:MarR family transcriptional regulator [Solirubrobacterales bacterium]
MPMTKDGNSKVGEEGTAREAWKLLVALVYPPRFLEIARKLGLTPAQLGAVRLLDEPRTMGEIATFLHCDPSNVTGIVDGLEERGFAERRPAEHDRRVKLIALTAEGRRLRTRLTREIERPPEWLAGLSAADQRTLRDLLRRAADPTG